MLEMIDGPYRKQRKSSGWVEKEEAMDVCGAFIKIHVGSRLDMNSENERGRQTARPRFESKDE